MTVHDGYRPSRIQVAAGTPVRILFDRQEAGDCTSQVVFPDFGTTAELPAFGRAGTNDPQARGQSLYPVLRGPRFQRGDGRHAG